jgi:hypothetical protein
LARDFLSGTILPPELGKDHLMAILNDELKWSSIAAARPGVSMAFRGTPEKTLLALNTMLCRFITTESKRNGIPGNHVFFSPWWMEWTTAVGMLARFKGAAPKEVVRARLAVTSEFSRELDSLVQIILTQPVYAWKGFAHYQNDNASQVTYIGGGTQFYLPNLASDAQGLSSNVAYMHCFTLVDSLG